MTRFLRPAARAALGRWGESAVATAVTSVLGAQGVPGALAGRPLGWLMTAGMVVGLLWLRTAVLRALARPPGGSAGAVPGAVVIREGQVGFVGPGHGALFALDALEQVEIVRLSELDTPMWRLTADDGSVLLVPADAEGAEELPAALAALPDFSDLAAVRALASLRAGRRVVWRRRVLPLSAARGREEGGRAGKPPPRRLPPRSM